MPCSYHLFSTSVFAICSYRRVALLCSQEPFEHKRLGYVEEDLSGLTPYAPILADQPLQPPAEEEELFVRPSGIVPSVKELPKMPGMCSQMPFVSLDIGSRYNNDQVPDVPAARVR